MTYPTTFNGVEVTDLFWWNYNATERIVVNQGGSSSGKTYNILMVLWFRLMLNPGKVCTVVGSTIPNLKKGALRDMERIFADNPIMANCIESFNRSDRVYRLSNGSLMEFTSYEDEFQARSGKRDYAFFNEANSISYEVFNQVAMRTALQMYIDYNPTAAFWCHQFVIGQPETITIYSTFRDNRFAHPAIIAHIRRYKETDPESWKVYGLGKTGAVHGLVFPRINIVPEMPQKLRKFAFGLDFGYNDPTACVLVGEMDGAIYVKEVLYQFELTSREIAEKLKPIVRDTPVWCDAASPMAIAELKAAGINARAAAKGADSIIAGIDLIKGFKSINVTAESTNLIKEQQNYKWMERDGVQMDKPVDSFNHLWDATRYAATMTWKNHGLLPQMV